MRLFPTRQTKVDENESFLLPSFVAVGSFSTYYIAWTN